MARRNWALPILCILVLISGPNCGVTPTPSACPVSGGIQLSKTADDSLRNAPAPELYVGGGDPYEPGPLEVTTMTATPCDHNCPVPIQVHTPQAPGRYAVVQFQHGFLMDTRYYSQMLRHVASHGFIVLAPQMYPPSDVPMGQPSIEAEAATSVSILDWLPGNLAQVTGVTADTASVGLVGHSRGGKVTWLAASQASDRLKAIAGVDPMDGTAGGWSRVINGPFTFALPSLSLGAGLGSMPALIPGLTCAPDGVNHVQFYDASPSPAWHVVAPQAGHTDMFNDDLSGCGIACSYCPAGADRPGMRRLTAGLLVAFFRGTLQGDASAMAYLTDSALAPIPVQMESR